MRNLQTAILLFLISSIAAYSQAGPQDIIPIPAETEMREGIYVPVPDGSDIRISLTDKKFAKRAQTLPDFARDAAYELDITRKGIEIKALSDRGAFYARKTLEQMLEISDTLSQCIVFDYPRFPHRGLMLDVSRNFRSKDFILKQIDVMASLKMNTLHFHLTNSAGWRIEMENYPALNTEGSYRLGYTYKEWEKLGRKFLPKGAENACGGYYTKEELKEIVEYAAQRHINVMPEIEMPGHCMEVVHAYPELSCLSADGSHPVYGFDVCPSADETYRFFEGVLDEILEIFPSEYIHLGGDEAVKRNWHTCPRCKAKMEQEGMQSVDELQAALMKHMEKYLAAKGRRLVGWDEILDGGLPPQATVMSWRGVSGGLKAISMGHDVIMSPNTHCYLDFYQDAPAFEPEAIGGYLPLSQVYSYDPVSRIPEEDAHHVLGVQGNLWTEYIFTEQQFEYMLYPRSFAIAEIGWSPKERKDYSGFKERTTLLTDVMKGKGYNVFDIRKEYGPRRESLTEGNHLAAGKPLTYNIKDSSPYIASGPQSLADGRYGNWVYGDRWMGFRNDIDVTIDLGETTPVHYVTATFWHHPPYSVGLPQRIEVWLSDDGENWTLAGTFESEMMKEISRTLHVQIGGPVSASGRYLRYKAFREIPWRYTWMFVDEVSVY